MYCRKIGVFLFILFWVLCMLNISARAGYSPQISGRLEREQKTYTDFQKDGEDIVDLYDRDRIWVRYRQQLGVGEYYYIRGQYSHRDYQERDYFSSLTFDLWTNYTFYIRDELRSRLKLDLRDRSYYQAQAKSYRRLSLSGELDIDYGAPHEYTIELQRRWDKYQFDSTRDNIRDVLTVDWDYEVSPQLDITTALRMEREVHDPRAESTNKYGRRVSLNFDYTLE